MPFYIHYALWSRVCSRILFIFLIELFIFFLWCFESFLYILYRILCQICDLQTFSPSWWLCLFILFTAYLIENFFLTLSCLRNPWLIPGHKDFFFNISFFNFTLQFMIYLELIFLQDMRLRFFFWHLSNYSAVPTLFIEKAIFFSIYLPLYLKNTGHICLDLFLDSILLYSSICLSP